MENVETKQLAYFNSEEMLDVVASRGTMRESSHSAPDYREWFRNPATYDTHYVLGFYGEGKLQGFIFCKVWPEILPPLDIVYSRIMFTRPTGFKDKHPNGFPMFTTHMLNEQTYFMESKGYYTNYEIIASKNWLMYHNNVHCHAVQRYTRTEMETIAPGQITKYPLFQKHLQVRPYDVELKIRKFYLPEDKRVNKDS